MPSEEFTENACPLCEEWMHRPDDKYNGEPVRQFGGSPTNPYGHARCLDALAAQIEAAVTVEDIRECIDRYYLGNAAGGSLHIVLDDFGYDDENVQFCIDGADPDGGYPDALGAALGRKLLRLSVEDRAAANDPHTCKCGHAMSLHTWRAPDGRWGYSSAGACASRTCACLDATEATA